VYLTTVDPQLLLRALGWAVRLAVLYACVQLAFWYFDSAWLSAVNGNTQVGTQYGVSLPRNGSMREGNYLGVFSVVSVFLLAYRRDGLGVILALLLLAYTQSTGAMGGLLIGVVLGVILRPTLRRMLISIAVAAVVLLVVLTIPAANRLMRGQLTKLGLIENEFGPSYTYSLNHRTAQADTAFSMAVDNPVVGVGQGRYAYYFDEYLDRASVPSNFGDNWSRPIANNVYAQLSAETGIIALLVFASIIIILAVSAIRRSSTLTAAVVALATSIVAFPAWTNLFLWGLIGIVLNVTSTAEAAASRAQLRRENRRGARLRAWSLRAIPGR
ncbi:O-antigen ligase family protein, partial [Alcanivoracaceae bacterium MT1]